MSRDKSKPAPDKARTAAPAAKNEPTGSKAAAAAAAAKPAARVVPPLYRAIDWWTLLITTTVVMVGYLLSIAPDCTLEDCGELATASFYAGVPHPPGYPVWTMYTWLWTVLLPVSNIAFRVAVASAFAGALSCGIIAMLVSRGSSMIIEGQDELKGIDKKWENALCMVCGFVAGMLMGFNGFMWSQSVIVEVYSFCVLSLMGVLACLFRWMHATEQRRYLYWGLFLFGICFNNHQTLIVAAMGIEIAILCRDAKLGRDMMLANSIIFVCGLLYLASQPQGGVNIIMKGVFIGVGICSIAGCVWLTMKTERLGTEFLHVLVMGVLYAVGVGFYLYMPLTSMSNPPLNWGYPRTREGFWHALMRGQYENANPTDDPLRFFSQMHLYTRGAIEEFNIIFLIIGLVPFVYLFLRWMKRKDQGWLLSISAGYVVLFLALVMHDMHVRSRNALATGTPVGDLMDLYASAFLGAGYGWFYLVLMVLPFVFYRLMDRPERAWVAGLSGIYLCLALILLLLLNPQPDRQSLALNRVFFTSSHVLIAMCIGYGLAIIGALMATQYERIRMPLLIGTGVAGAIALYVMVVTFSTGPTTDLEGNGPFMDLFDLASSYNPYTRIAAISGVAMAAVMAGILIAWPKRAPMALVVGLFAFLPVRSMTSHWWDNEQYGHLFGFWFGHDMFTPPFPGKDGKLTYDTKQRAELLKDPAKAKLIYPEMDEHTVLFGGTDPGRFNPTYMIYCESFIKPNQRRNPEFDRRDVYLITQNALADATYLEYIRAHYNRSAQIDPPFFQEFLPRLLRPLGKPLDVMFTALGDRIEKSRRAGSSYFAASDFLHPAALATRLKSGQDPVAKYVFDNLTDNGKKAVGAGGSESALSSTLATEFNRLLEAGPLYESNRFAQVKLTQHVDDFTKENPQSHTRIRLNRLLLESAWPDDLAKSPGGVFPDLEILTPTYEDSQHAFEDYVKDAQKRMNLNQLKPGENVRIENGQIKVTGQVAVMAINGLLTKVIFDKNPHHEFYVEESFPLDWMYPHLTPYGIIMKINRQPLAELNDDIVQRDHYFWSEYSDRLIGNWITYDTKVKDICEFAEKVYLRNNLEGFKGDPKFIRDDNAQKAFSKLRSAIGGVYIWRINQSRSTVEQQRMIKEADFAFRQAFAFCPYSPEAVYRYVQLLSSMSVQRNDPEMLKDAILIARTAQKLDPANGGIRAVGDQLEGQYSNTVQRAGSAIRAPNAGLTPNEPNAQPTLSSMENAFQSNPKDVQNAINLAVSYCRLQRTNDAIKVFNALSTAPGATEVTHLSVARAYSEMKMPQGVHVSAMLATNLLGPKLISPTADVVTVTLAAQAFSMLGDLPNLEPTLARLVKLSPNDAAVWFDFGTVQAVAGQQLIGKGQSSEADAKNKAAIAALGNALRLNKLQREQVPGTIDMRVMIRQDDRFNALRVMPEFKQLPLN